jgi:hypothetical protein
MKRIIALTVLLTTGAHAEKFDTWFAASPDNKLFAVERRVPHPREPSRLDMDSFVVFICTRLAHSSFEVAGQGPVIAQHTFADRIVSQIGWSPDSKFLLFTTASSGGHSPWHFRTFAFSVADKSFRDVETVLGAPVAAGEFRFEYPDIAVLSLYDPTHEHPKEIKLPLSKLVQQMLRLE